MCKWPRCGYQLVGETGVFLSTLVVESDAGLAADSTTGRAPKWEVFMKILLCLAIGLILATFLVDHFQHGWYRPIGQGPDETGVTPRNLWTTVDLRSLLILASLAFASANAAARFLRRGVRAQDGAEHPGPSQSRGTMVFAARALLWSGIVLILLTFLVVRLRYGFLGVVKQVATTPSGKAMVTMIWTPVDLGCYLIIAYLALALAKTSIRFLRARVTPQE